MSSIAQKNLLQSLIKANDGILKQKLTLLDILLTKHGSQETTKLFTKTCPILHASIGQHYRHSMDHMELAILNASTATTIRRTKYNDANSDLSLAVLRYDLRVRGGTLEKDVDETRKRINSVMDVLYELETRIEDHGGDDGITGRRVNAAFMLSSDGNDEMELESTIGRELGFCAHHGIHHMAMVKIIATQTLGINMDELPVDFGKAPSTVRFEEDQN